MTGALHHRGPDGSDHWLDDDVGVALGHRRLAILDLSEAGRQPMHSSCGRYVLTYNGEIYNYLDLQTELLANGARFRGHSDTEVILGAIQSWGLVETLKRLNGMFAFALWDREERVLHLARDRVGQKPLYFGHVGKTFVFASELKAIGTLPGFDTSTNREALALLMRYGYIPAPRSIYTGIQKLLPGTVLSLHANTMEVSALSPYWSAQSVFERGRNQPFRRTFTEAADELEELLRDAVRRCMVSDVPLGAFLSGGIDSSLVVAMMQAQSAVPIKTFSIGFADPKYDEAVHAGRVARHLGTQHTELYVSESDALEVIPKLPILYDEPFADSSQIPTFLVSALARSSVTVSLSGDGGDELFCGYQRYDWFNKLTRMRGVMGPTLFGATGSLLRHMPASMTDMALQKTLGRVRPGFRNATWGDRLNKLGEWMEHAMDDKTTYRALTSIWKDPSALVRSTGEPEEDYAHWQTGALGEDMTRHAILQDILQYLPDDILTKVDRAAMGVSLETRIPLLDHRLIEFAATLPVSMNFDGTKGKLLLREVLSRHVPRELFERPKQGFAIPVREWLRQDLRDWAEDLLAPKRLREEGYFVEQAVSSKWREHVEGKREWHAQLWPILMFQAWQQSNCS